MPGVLDGKAALITGGGTGIGKGIAEAFAREGAAVALAGRRKEVVEATAAELQGRGTKALALAGDVSKPADCARLVEETVKSLGALHILVNNAGIYRQGRLETISDANLNALVDINLKGPLFLVRAAWPHLHLHKESGGAWILNISTSATLSAVKDFPVYAAAKAGLDHLTRCLALDYGPEQVRVNCICPGVVETPIFETVMPKRVVAKALQQLATQHPLGRVGAPQDIAELAVFLCSPAAAWITGAVVPVDGGLSLA